MLEIIDAHLHTNFEDELMLKAAKGSLVNYSLEGLREELSENNISLALSLSTQSKNGNLDFDFPTPLLLECPLKNVHNVLAINPYQAGWEELEKTEELLKRGAVQGLKIYLGYFPFYPEDEKYFPFYQLAEKYNLPVIFHTGDTYAEKARVKFAHPLNIDEVAVKFPQVKLVIAHLGNPWLMDAAEVVWKNKNVYADLSGLCVGSLEEIKGISLNHLKEALNYCGYEKILYGSDWPIVPMKPYLKLIQEIVPVEFQKKVFGENARKVFYLPT